MSLLWSWSGGPRVDRPNVVGGLVPHRRDAVTQSTIDAWPVSLRGEQLGEESRIDAEILSNSRLPRTLVAVEIEPVASQREPSRVA